MKKSTRAIRKSAYVTYRKCKKKFEYYYNDPDYWDYGNKDKGTTSEAQQKGLDFHTACEHFFREFEGRVITKNMPKTFRNPFSVDNGDLFDWFNFFLEEETKRWIDLEEDNKVGYWFPVANEIEIRSEDVRDRTGHVDRVDIMPDDNLCIVEYKTGRSYDMDNPYALTDMNQEIGFYVSILRKANVFPDKKITKWKVINPTLKKIWINSITPISLRTVDSTLKEINNKLDNDGEFPRNEGVLCLYCPYASECLYGDDELINFDKPI